MLFSSLLSEPDPATLVGSSNRQQDSSRGRFSPTKKSCPYEQISREKMDRDRGSKRCRTSMKHDLHPSYCFHDTVGLDFEESTKVGYNQRCLILMNTEYFSPPLDLASDNQGLWLYAKNRSQCTQTRIFPLSINEASLGQQLQIFLARRSALTSDNFHLGAEQIDHKAVLNLEQ